MGAGQSSNKIRLECFLDESDDTNDSIVSGVVRLQVRKNVRNLDEHFEGIVLTLDGEEVLVNVDANKSRYSSIFRDSKRTSDSTEADPSLRKVQLERMIMDFEYTEVGDGIDFTFPFSLDLSNKLSSEVEKDTEDMPPSILEMSSNSSDSSQSMDSLDGSRSGGSTTRRKQMVYRLKASLRRKPHVRPSHANNIWCNAIPCQ